MREKEANEELEREQRQLLDEKNQREIEAQRIKEAQKLSLSILELEMKKKSPENFFWDLFNKILRIQCSEDNPWPCQECE